MDVFFFARQKRFLMDLQGVLVSDWIPQISSEAEAAALDRHSLSRHGEVRMLITVT